MGIDKTWQKSGYSYKSVHYLDLKGIQIWNGFYQTTNTDSGRFWNTYTTAFEFRNHFWPVAGALLIYSPSTEYVKTLFYLNMLRKWRSLQGKASSGMWIRQTDRQVKGADISSHADDQDDEFRCRCCYFSTAEPTVLTRRRRVTS